VSSILWKKRGGLWKGGKTGHLRSEDDYPNFKGRMMVNPSSIRTVIISVVNILSAENGCQPVLIQHSIYIHADANSND
jgi:hypothetical protein